MPASPPNVEAVAAFIEKIHIFDGITEDDLFDIAERLDDKRFQAGDVILETDQPAESFYIIYAGKVDVTREEKGQRYSRFSGGDYFGVDVFFENQKRGTKITAQEDTLLLELPRDVFMEIPTAIDFLQDQIAAFQLCRELLEKENFDWVEKNEAIYFVVNKHPVLFWRRAVLPLLLLLGAPATALWGMWVGAMFPLIFGALGFVIGFLWILWDWLDWRNDHYIVTNHRVVWLEKIIGFFDSRQEAHMVEVKSVDAQTDALVQTFFDYGNVNVNTIFGGVELKYIPYPRQAHILIEELWHRSQRQEEKRAKDRLQKAIAEQLEAARSVEERKRKPPPKPKEETKKTFLQRLFSREKKKKAGIFSLRYEEGKEIIYRKHIVVLLKQIGAPAALTVVLSMYLIYRLSFIFFPEISGVPSISFITFLILGLVIAIGWLIYQYIDWTNDIFKVSEDKIFDIDRKPLGDVQSRSAELKNILSTEYRRTGIMSVLFNYGTVYINIGTEELEFQDVLDPAAVQQDINHRYNAVQEKEKIAKEKKERNEMIKWLVAYHESTPDIDAMIDEIKEIKQQQGDIQEDDEGVG